MINSTLLMLDVSFIYLVNPPNGVKTIVNVETYMKMFHNYVSLICK